MKSNEGFVERILIKKQGENISREIPEGKITLEGLAGDSHYGLTMLTHGHNPEYPKGTEIRNNRQITILSADELIEIARALNIPKVDISWLSGNILISGIKNFSVVPLGSKIIFANGVVLTSSGENNPCKTPASITQSHYPEIEGIARDFIKAAMHRRGIIAWTEHAGTILPGERFRIELPNSWDPAWLNERE